MSQNQISTIQLYVEKYIPSKREILFDFIDDKEFAFIRYSGGNAPNSLTEYQPTMILLRDFRANIMIEEGYVIVVDATI